MFIINFLLFLLTAGLIAGTIAAAYNKLKIAYPAGIAAAVFGLLFLLSLTFVQIEAGYVGVVKQFGQIQPNTLGPGLHVVIPFANTVETVDTRVRQIRIENYGAASLEQQNLFLTVTLNYHVNPNQAQNIVQTIGLDYEAKIVLPRLLDIPKTITDDYPTTTVLNKREEIRQKASDLLKVELDRHGFIVDGLVLENFDYSPEYNAAIEQKQVAQQQVEIERQKVQQAEQIKLQREAQARADKEVAITQAQGQAEVVRLNAEAQAIANQKLSASITDTLIQYQMVQKLSDKIQIMMLPSSSNFLLDPKSLLGGTVK